MVETTPAEMREVRAALNLPPGLLGLLTSPSRTPGGGGDGEVFRERTHSGINWFSRADRVG